MATLSTHILDNTRGKPAEGVVIHFSPIQNRELHHLKRTIPNADGRPAEPLSSDPLGPGIYELTFHAGDYFRSAGVKLPDPPFLDEIVIRFGIGDGAAHYHVPLLLSTYGYS